MARKPIRINVRHTNESLNNDNIPNRREVQEQPVNPQDQTTDELQDLKNKFFDIVKNTDLATAEEFIEGKLKIPVHGNIGQNIKELNNRLKTVSALKFATSELVEYLKLHNKPVPNDTSESDNASRFANSGPQQYDQDSMQSDQHTSNFEDFSQDPFEDDNIEGFMRESIKKSIDLLNEILRRLIRLEERADLQNEINKKIDSRCIALESAANEHDEKIDTIEVDLKALKSSIIQTVGNGNIQPNSIELRLPNNEIRNIEGIFPKEWPEMLELGSARKNILLCGPTGCGKTFLSEKLAEALKLDYASVSCTEGMSESEFKGWLLPLGEAGKFEYIPSDFVNCYENGGLFCADEFDAIDPNVATWVNKALAGNSFNLPMRRDNTIVKKHKDFVWVACANTMGTGADMLYTGRNQLDGALIDRHLVGTIKMDYDNNVESKLINPDVLLWGVNMRKAMKNLQINNKPLSTRYMIDSSEMMAMYPKRWDIKFIENTFYKNWARDNIKRCRQEFKSVIANELGGLQ